jgi:hypothetical protein
VTDDDKSRAYPGLFFGLELGNYSASPPLTVEQRCDFPVISVFPDVLAIDHGDIMNFGITKEEVGDFPKMVEDHSLKPLILRSNNAHHHCNQVLSIGNLAGVDRLEVQRNEKRCFGLRIEHIDGMVEILGQWDPSTTLEISQIYERTQSALKEICFCSEGLTVTDILIGYGEGTA